MARILGSVLDSTLGCVFDSVLDSVSVLFCVRFEATTGGMTVLVESNSSALSRSSKSETLIMSSLTSGVDVGGRLDVILRPREALDVAGLFPLGGAFEETLPFRGLVALVDLSPVAFDSLSSGLGVCGLEEGFDEVSRLARFILMFIVSGLDAVCPNLALVALAPCACLPTLDPTLAPTLVPTLPEAFVVVFVVVALKPGPATVGDIALLLLLFLVTFSGAPGDIVGIGKFDSAEEVHSDMDFRHFSALRVLLTRIVLPSCRSFTMGTLLVSVAGWSSK